MIKFVFKIRTAALTAAVAGYILITAGISAFNVAASDEIIINPGSENSETFLKGWDFGFTRELLVKWGRDRGGKMHPDRGGVSDGIAAFVKERGSRVIVSGLKRGMQYRLWIDFVVYKWTKPFDTPSILKIYAITRSAERRLLTEVRYYEIDDIFYSLDIPYDLTITGSVELLFEETARVKGMWGIWDMAIAPKGWKPLDQKPEPGPENMEIKDTIIR